MGFLLVDIGGTNIRVAVASDYETVGEVEKFSTPDTPEATLARIQELAAELCGYIAVEAVAVGVRGQLHEDKRSLQHDSALRAWIDYPLADNLAEIYNCPVYLENDTALAGLGEANYGAAKDFDIVAYHTVSTGVGGVRIESGKIDAASIGFEPGHQILDIDRTVLGDDVTPTLENLISGTAVAERMGQEPYEIDQNDIIWDTLAKYLGQGLRNTILYWSPEIIVLGGSMILGDPRIQIDAIRKHTVSALDGFVEAPFITTAQLGDLSGLYGALAYIKQQNTLEF